MAIFMCIMYIHTSTNNPLMLNYYKKIESKMGNYISLHWTQLSEKKLVSLISRVEDIE